MNCNNERLYCVAGEGIIGQRITGEGITREGITGEKSGNKNRRRIMNWSNRQSILLTKCCIWLFMAGYLLVLLTCPFLMKIFVRFNYSAYGKDARLFIASVYACAVPVGLILWHLSGLIKDIGKEDIFTEKNIRRLRFISWMCGATGLICFLSMAYYLFWGIMGCCMVFMCLLIRVIKNVFVRAKELKDENDFTI